MLPIEPRVNPALHDEAVRAEDTDWPQILALYELLGRPSPSPVVTLNRAVALAMVEGPTARLELLASLEANGRLAAHHRLDAVLGAPAGDGWRSHRRPRPRRGRGPADDQPT
jgi:predicted RNA polymerase sigma factor